MVFPNSHCSKRVGIAEHLIKFRSSPNLRNIKKFIRPKMDHIEIINLAEPDSPPPPNISLSEPERPEDQPPFSLEPPPPDEDYSLHVNQELVDDEYESSPTPSGVQNEYPINYENIIEEAREISEVPICRDFVRGTCNRPGTCKYAHKYDLTQLVGIYTFCREYQSSVCTYPVCKYLHATVFEEHHFYRTGILPPHAFAHHKKANVMQPTPPPPPPPPLPPSPSPQKKHPTNLSANTNVPMNLTFTNLPPPLRNEISQEEIGRTVPLRSDRKRQWNSLEQFGSTQSNRDSNELFATKCKHCGIMDFRLQYNKDKLENMLLSKDNLCEEMSMLEKKIEKLCTLTSTLLSDTADDRLGGVIQAPKLWLREITFRHSNITYTVNKGSAQL